MVDEKELFELLKTKGLDGSSSPTKKEVKISSSIRDFISAFSIKEANEKVPNYIIFYQYRKHCRNLGKDGLPKIAFFKQFGTLFNSHRIGARRSYFLDRGSFDLSREGKLEAKHYDRQYQLQAKANTKKKKAETSRTKQTNEPEV